MAKTRSIPWPRLGVFHGQSYMQKCNANILNIAQLKMPPRRKCSERNIGGQHLGGVGERQLETIPLPPKKSVY